MPELTRRNLLTLGGVAVVSVTAAVLGIAKVTKPVSESVDDDTAEPAVGSGNATVPVPPGYPELPKNEVDSNIPSGIVPIRQSGKDFGNAYIPPIYPLPKDRRGWGYAEYWDHGYYDTSSDED